MKGPKGRGRGGGARPGRGGAGKQQQKKPKEDYGWMDDEARAHSGSRGDSHFADAQPWPTEPLNHTAARHTRNAG